MQKYMLEVPSSSGRILGFGILMKKPEGGGSSPPGTTCALDPAALGSTPAGTTLHTTIFKYKISHIKYW